MAGSVRRSARAAGVVAKLRVHRTHAVLLQDAFAAQLGINATDLVCGDLIFRNPGISPGKLASMSGLTTGAITAVIDHLEAAGYVRRERDPEDGRRIRLLPTAGKIAEVRGVYARLNANLSRLCENFTIDQLGAIERFLDETRAAMESETTELRFRARVEAL